VLTVVTPDTASVAYDVYPEEVTSIRLGDAGALGLMIGDRALVKLTVLLNDAARAMRTARTAPGIDAPAEQYMTDASKED